MVRRTILRVRANSILDISKRSLESDIRSLTDSDHYCVRLEAAALINPSMLWMLRVESASVHFQMTFYQNGRASDDINVKNMLNITLILNEINMQACTHIKVICNTKLDYIHSPAHGCNTQPPCVAPSRESARVIA